MTIVFTSAQSVFGGIQFQKTRFILPLHFVHLKVKMYFDFKEDPGVRGGRQPFLVAIFSDIGVDDGFFEFFDEDVERALEAYKEKESAQVSEIVEIFKEITSIDSSGEQIQFDANEYTLEDARRDLTLAKKSIERKDARTAQVLLVKAGRRFLVDSHHLDAGKCFQLAGELAAGLNNFEKAYDFFENAYKSYSEAGEVEDATIAEYYMGFAKLKRKMYAEALVNFQNTRDKLQGTPFAPRIEQHLAEIYQQIGEFEKARTAFEEAIERYEARENHQVLGELTKNYADLLVNQYLKPFIESHGGRIRAPKDRGVLLEEIVSMYKLSAKSWRYLNLKYEEAIAYEKLARALDISGFLIRSNSYYERAYEIFRDIGEPVRAINNLVNIGNNLGQLGEIDEAFEVYTRAFTEFRGESLGLLDIEVLEPLFYPSEHGGSMISDAGEFTPRIIDEDMLTVTRQNPELTKKVVPLLKLVIEEAKKAKSYIEAAKIAEKAYELNHFVGNLDGAEECKQNAMENYLHACEQHHSFARMNLQYEHNYEMAQKYALLALQWATSGLLFAPPEKRGEILDLIREEFNFTKRVLRVVPLNSIRKNSIERFQRLYAIYKKIRRRLDELDEYWEEIYDEITLRKSTFQVGSTK
ncbi:MAG: hypothetical protein ACTSU5_06005 [Promethearchaeota archaeon]